MYFATRVRDFRNGQEVGVFFEGALRASFGEFQTYLDGGSSRSFVFQSDLKPVDVSSTLLKSLLGVTMPGIAWLQPVPLKLGRNGEVPFELNVDEVAELKSCGLL